MSIGGLGYVLKGVLVGTDYVVWVAIGAATTVIYSVPKVGDLRVSGAGDSLAAALTAELAKGKDLHAAVSVAKDFVTRGIAQSLDAGTPFGVVWQG